MNTSDVLNKAADVIQRDGWHQSGYAPDQSHDGAPIDGLPVCAMGAIYQAAEVPVRWSVSLGCWIGFGQFSAGDMAGRALRVHVDSDVPVWNDAKGRTATEVVEALRACAVIEAAKETAPAEQVTA